MQLRPHQQEDRGSAMIIAVTVLMILGTLSLAVVARTQSGLRSARQNEDFAGALAKADAGVSDALFRLDQMATPVNFCVGPAPSCTVASIPTAPDVEYAVRVVSNTTVEIMSKGVVNGVPHAVKAQLVRSAEFPAAIFGRTAVSFRGNVDGPSCTQVNMPCQGVYTVDTATPPNVLPIAAVAATAGTVRCTGNESPATNQVTYPGGLNNSCPNSYVVNGVYDPVDPITGPCPAPTHSPPIPCRGDFYATPPGGCANVTGVIPPGIYYCPTHLNFTGAVSVGAGYLNDGKVEIFVIPTAGRMNIDFNGATLNLGGDPTKLRINLAGSGDVDGGNGTPAGDITGIVYAPGATMTADGCKIKIRGTLVINDYTCNGSPNLQIQYDTRIAPLMSSSWSQANYTEMPTAQFSLL